MNCGSLEWRDAQRYGGDPDSVFDLIVWWFQVLFVLGAVYFHRTETPRETLWFGNAESSSFAVLHVDYVPSVLKQLALHFPELTETKIEEIIKLAVQATTEGDASTMFETMLRNKPEQVFIVFESWNTDELELVIHAHFDLLIEVDEVLKPY